MILTKKRILEEHSCGMIHIDPFDPEMVSVNSVDVRLGPDMFALRRCRDLPRDLFSDPRDGWDQIYPGPPPEGHSLPRDAEGFLLRSGGFYLGTTLEEIGAKEPSPGKPAIVPKMHAKSTTGRLGLTVALCAGVGDVGYHSRWALEIRVVDCGDVFLPIGTVLAQVVFFYATECSQVYGGVDNYQETPSSPSRRFLPKSLKYKVP